jgi:hypothetical protein
VLSEHAQQQLELLFASARTANGLWTAVSGVENLSTQEKGGGEGVGRTLAVEYFKQRKANRWQAGEHGVGFAVGVCFAAPPEWTNSVTQ